MIQGKCEYCGEDKAIRNPTGKCDHLYYPDNVNKNHSLQQPLRKKEVGSDQPSQDMKLAYSSADALFIRRYNKFSNLCVLEGMRNLKEIAELFRVKEELGLEG